MLRALPEPLVKRLLAVAFLGLVLALAAAAGYAFQLRCEGFGCTGVGILWFAWAALFVPVLAFGIVLRANLPPGMVLRAAVSAGVFLMAAMVAVLLGYWQFHAAA